MTTNQGTSKKRASILNAAAQAFIDEGYDNASMDRISELAGASKRTVYNHFPSKEALFQAVLCEMMEETVPLKHIPYSPKRPLTAQLGAFADAKLAVVKNPTWLGTMKVTVGVFISNPNLAREVMKLAEDEEDYLVTWLEAADADGRLNVPDPTFAADLFWSMVSGALFWPVLFFGAHSIAKTKALKKEIIDMFLTRYAV